MFDAELTLFEIAPRLAAATLCGAVLGFEREAQDKPAGLRTNMLVSVGAAAAMLLTLDLCHEMAALGGSDGSSAKLDPLRTVAGVIGGIGFLGAGSIFKSEREVEGLTTAAAIWTSGAIGLSCGAGRFLIAGVTTVLALVILEVVGRLQASLKKSKGDGG